MPAGGPAESDGVFEARAARRLGEQREAPGRQPSLSARVESLRRKSRRRGRRGRRRSGAAGRWDAAPSVHLPAWALRATRPLRTPRLAANECSNSWRSATCSTASSTTASPSVRISEMIFLPECCREDARNASWKATPGEPGELQHRRCQVDEQLLWDSRSNQCWPFVWRIMFHPLGSTMWQNSADAGQQCGRCCTKSGRCRPKVAIIGQTLGRTW